jgi:phosphate transport system permease protein
LTEYPPLRRTAGATGPGGSISLRSRPRPKERAIRAFLAACGVVSVLTTLGIVATLGFETFEFFREVSLVEFFTTTKWSALIPPEAYGVIPLVTGTLMVALLSAIVGIPLGVGTAIYLSEYATPKVRRRLKPALEILAGLPTVVLGYFALTFVTRVVLRGITDDVSYYNVLSAGVVVGVMVVPIIASVSEDAMSAVPRALREGAYGLGASKMTVGIRVVVPAALSGIMAAIILGVSRAIGETMIVTIASGSTPRLCYNPLKGCQAMTGYIAQASFGDVGRGGTVYNSIFAVGGFLFIFTLGLNIVSQRLVRRFRQVY